MVLFPTLTCVDNFFEDPDSVRNYALSCNFSKIPGNYPGIRTNPLHIIDPNFYESVIQKIKSILYKNTENNNIKIRMYFQKMFKHSEDINNPANNGWSHIDDGSTAAGLVYLNNNVKNIDSGTIICDQKDIERKKPYDYFYRDILYKKPELLNDKDFMDQYEKNIIKHNENFDDSIIVKNKYNRFIFYTKETWHRQQNISINSNEDRLTLVMFLE